VGDRQLFLKGDLKKPGNPNLVAGAVEADGNASGDCFVPGALHLSLAHPRAHSH
jgi:hypothetical protein